MRESFSIALRQGNRPLRLASLGDDGILLENDGDVWPRRVVLEFDARSRATEARMEWVRQSQGWHPFTFKLDRFVNGDRQLAFKGVDVRALPPGIYWLRLRISGLDIKRGRINFRIKEDEAVEVRVNVKKDPRRFVLTERIRSFDPQILRVLEADESVVDGNRPLVDWLRDRQVRGQRKACLMNVLAKLRTAPDKRRPLIGHVGSVRFVDVDRIYATVDRDFADRLKRMSGGEQRKFDNGREPASGTHAKLLQKLHLDAADYRLKSFRQKARPSLQAVAAEPRDETTPGPRAADLDIDLGNPLNDVVGFVIHIGEVLHPAKTDHFALRKDLAKKNTKEFLYYRVGRG